MDTQTLRRLLKAGLTNDQIGDRMKRHKDVIRRKVCALGLEPGQSPMLNAMMMRIRYRRRMAQARV